jgi:NADPH:quinone reductase-like Zn-dependent oxidoreductase
VAGVVEAVGPGGAAAPLWKVGDFPLDEAPAALRFMKAGESVGKIVLV